MTVGPPGGHRRGGGVRALVCARGNGRARERGRARRFERALSEGSAVLSGVDERRGDVWRRAGDGSADL